MTRLKQYDADVRTIIKTESNPCVFDISAMTRENTHTLVRIPLFIGTILAIFALIASASAYATPESIVASGKVYVSDITYDPAAFFSGDTGTVAFDVTNGNTDQGIVINHATFADQLSDFKLLSGTYDNSATIGPGKTQTFTFSVKADAPDGTYYPMFSISFRDADSLWEKTMVKIDNTPIVLTVIDKPDTFSEGSRKTITVQVANPRNNDVKNVILEASGPGITATPSQYYIGVLASGTDVNRTVSITPTTESPLKITVNYDNGDNHHTVSLDMPVSFAPDKKKASPQMSNVKVKLDSGVYDVTGDITNSGLQTANGVSVTALSPAVPQDPYKNYVIGALKPDDFGSYEVTFKASGAGSVPLQMSYKDTDGNVITSQQDVALTVADSAQAQNSPSVLPIIAIVIIIAACGGYLYYRRKKNQ